MLRPYLQIVVPNLHIDTCKWQGIGEQELSQLLQETLVVDA